jgi:hypothetical protein
MKYIHIITILVTTDRCWIDDQIYWTLSHSTWARDYTLQFTITHTDSCPQSCLHCHCLVAASNGGLSPSSVFPNHSQPQLPASNSNSSQQLNHSSSLMDSPTNSTDSLLTNRNSHSSESELLYYWWFTTYQFILALSPLRLTTSFFFFFFFGNWTLVVINLM